MRLTNKAIAIVAAALSTAAVIAFWAMGKAGDCTPHQIDGQCGLSTFIGLLYGGLAVVVIVLSAGLLIAVRLWSANRHLAK